MLMSFDDYVELLRESKEVDTTSSMQIEFNRDEKTLSIIPKVERKDLDTWNQLGKFDLSLVLSEDSVYYLDNRMELVYKYTGKSIYKDYKVGSPLLFKADPGLQYYNFVHYISEDKLVEGNAPDYEVKVTDGTEGCVMNGKLVILDPGYLFEPEMFDYICGKCNKYQTFFATLRVKKKIFKFIGQWLKMPGEVESGHQYDMTKQPFTGKIAMEHNLYIIMESVQAEYFVGTSTIKSVKSLYDTFAGKYKPRKESELFIKPDGGSSFIIEPVEK